MATSNQDRYSIAVKQLMKIIQPLQKKLLSYLDDTSLGLVCSMEKIVNGYTNVIEMSNILDLDFFSGLTTVFFS